MYDYSHILDQVHNKVVILPTIVVPKMDNGSECVMEIVKITYWDVLDAIEQSDMVLCYVKNYNIVKLLGIFDSEVYEYYEPGVGDVYYVVKYRYGFCDDNVFSYDELDCYMVSVCDVNSNPRLRLS